MHPMAVTSLAYWRKKVFFSSAERSFYEILRRIAPDYTVFAKVRLCDVIFASARGKTWRTKHDRIQSKHLDFLICDATLAPVMAVELGDSSQTEANRKTCDQLVDAALAAARVPILRIPVARSYAIDQIRPLVSPHLHGLGPAC